MELKILNKKDASLLSRAEINAEVIFESQTPSKEEVKKLYAQKEKADPNLVVVKHIHTDFGNKRAVVDIFVYSDAKEMEQLEKKKEKKKEASKGEKKEAPKAEAKEEKKEEKPAEEKKEEAPKEKPAEEKKE